MSSIPDVDTSKKLRRHVAYEAIRAKILAGELPSGAALSEAELAEMLGTSRTPVREALLRLQDEGLATILPRRGAIVRGLTLEEVHEGLLVRQALEGMAAALAATRVSRDTLRELRSNWEHLLETVSDSTLADLEKQGIGFHRVIVEAAANRTLARLLESIRFQVEGSKQLFLAGSGELAVRRARLLCEDHLLVIAALETGDPRRAERSMTEHLRRISSEILTGSA